MQVSVAAGLFHHQISFQHPLFSFFPRVCSFSTHHGGDRPEHQILSSSQYCDPTVVHTYQPACAPRLDVNASLSGAAPMDS